VVGTTNIITELDDKYDKTGGAISGSVQVSGTLAPNGNIITDQRLVIQSGNTMEIQDDTEVKISSGFVDIVVNGVDESINLNGYTQLNGSLNILEDESTFLNEVGGTDYKAINYFNYNKLTEDVEGKQDTITPATDLSCNSLNTKQLIDNDDSYFDTIVIRRVSASDILHFRELQLWINGVNVLPSYTIPASSSNNTSTNVSGNALGETIELLNANTTLTALVINGITYTASNIANEIIDGVGDIGYDCVGASNSSLYIPLNTTINTSEVQ